MKQSGHSLLTSDINMIFLPRRLLLLGYSLFFHTSLKNQLSDSQLELCLDHVFLNITTELQPCDWIIKLIVLRALEQQLNLKKLVNV